MSQARRNRAIEHQRAYGLVDFFVNRALRCLLNLKLFDIQPLKRETKMIVCKSHVVGQFYGYIGGEDYCLADGSIWKIITPIYRIRRTSCPHATVFRKNHRHFLVVHGMGEDVEVEAVYLPRCVLETPLGRTENHELQEQFDIPRLTERALAKWKRYEAMANT